MNKPKKNKCETCDVRACFNTPNLKWGRFCKNHKLDNMVDVKNKKCIYEGCKILPNFNYEGETKAIYCKSHSLENMVDVKNIDRICIYEGCNIRSNFNYEGETKPLYCKTHSLENMVDIKSKKCIFEGCKKMPSFNYEGKTTPIYCKEHSLENMVNIKREKCIYKECNKRPSYNYKGKTKALYCKNHSSENMVNIKDKRCPLCIDHIDSRFSNPKYDGYCATCFKRTFPEDERSKVIYSHSKEIRVRNFINEHFEGFIHDKPIYTHNCDCTHRRRIDHRKLIGNTILAVETDEHAHSSYDKYDEEIRYDDVYMIHSGKWIFIRFNPDGKDVDMEDKLDKLLEVMEEQIERIEREENTELVEIIKLFY